MRPRHHFTSLLLVLLAGCFLSACASRIPRRRTLPAWVQNVYVPMFQNSTAEPGLEEWGTIYAQEEFLADGRLKVSSKADADMIVAVDIEEYEAEPASFEDDEVPSIMRITTEALVKLYEPSNLDDPIMDLGKIEASHTYVSDFRRTEYTPDVDAKKDAMRVLAGRVVNETITGYRRAEEQDIEDDETGALEPRILGEQQVRSPYGVRTARGITISPNISDPVR